jgi:hypothetical protein
MRTLACCCRDGIGTDRNREEAKRWLDRIITCAPKDKTDYRDAVKLRNELDQKGPNGILATGSYDDMILRGINRCPQGSTDVGQTLPQIAFELRQAQPRLRGWPMAACSSLSRAE